MKLFLFFLFFFLFDLYFYFGFSPLLNGIRGEFFLKIIYWVLCALIYLGLVYFAINVQQDRHFTVPILLSSFFFIFFISKLVGSFPLLLDDIIRVARFLFKVFKSNTDEYSVGRIDFF